MGTTGPTKVLGTISAMNTFVENFPMSILDLSHGPTYTSIFVFLTDVLLACGVDVNEIISRVLEKIFGVAIQIDAVEQAILDMKIDDQSEFMKAMETSVKAILMALLTSIFSCSAIPFIQNKYMDGSGSKKLGVLQDQKLSGIIIPISAIDIFGMLGTNPFSRLGRLYYNIEGGDTYYGKVKNELVINHEEEVININKIKDYNKLGIVFGVGHEEYLKGPSNINLDVFFKVDEVSEGWSYFASGKAPSSENDANVSQFKTKIKEFAGKLVDGTKVTIVGSADLGTGSAERNSFLAPARACMVGKYLYDYCQEQGIDVEFNADFSKVDTARLKEIAKIKGTTHSELASYLNGIGINAESLIHYDIYETTELSRAAVIHAHCPGTEDSIMFRVENDLTEKMFISIEYVSPDGRMEPIEATINAGERESNIIPLTPIDELGRKGIISSIRINGESTSILTDDKTCVYLSKGKSQEVIDFWVSKGNTSFDCIKDLTDDEKKRGQEGEDLSNNKDVWDNIYHGQEREVFKDAYDEVIEYYTYEKISEKPSTATRVNVVPEGVDENAPDFIVNYQGLTPNTLYKTDDMNAFIWYSMYEGGYDPQTEYNKMMWDNRVPQREKYGIIRNGPDAWNKWYNSKESCIDKFKPVNLNTKEGIKPILQLESYEGRKDYIRVQFPAQVNKNEKSELFNTTIYKFNWQYLESIKIFKPKVILYGMFDSLLNNALSLILDTNVSFTKTYTRGILSNAIKKYIEADDMETEDCYFSFSNEEFDAMLRDMFLARYSATYNGGEENPAAMHDINDYLSKIDSVEFSATKEGEVNKITKLLNDVSVSAGREGSIDYGITIDGDKNWWKRLLWAIALPIIESIFTPQVMLLIMINFHIMGVVSLEDIFGTDQSAIVKLLTNKIFGLVRSIILYIKDKIAEILLELYIEKVIPLLLKMEAIRMLERIEAWMRVLRSALDCIPLFMFGLGLNQRRNNMLNGIEDVNYADIVNDQTKPETTNDC